jgi:predicted Zn-dependent protease
VATVARLIPESPQRLRAEAERAERAGDPAAAARAWRAFNATGEAEGATHRAEALAELSLGRAGRAEESLRRAIAADPGDVESWRLLLEILWVEDRALDAQRTVWALYDRVPAGSRRDVLRELTRALLGDLSPETARGALKRWIDSDPDDVDARVALWQRIAAQPRAGDPDRPARLAELEALVAAHPEHAGAREALVTALADAGEPDRGREVLGGWPGPEPDRDARYWRLRGQWELEYDRHPDRAAAAFRRALEAMPQDWRLWSGLARALKRMGRDDEARQAAAVVARIREALEPAAARLDDDFRRLEFDLQLIDWADGTDVPTSGNNLVIAGTDDRNVLHIRIFGPDGRRVTDADETTLPLAKARAIPIAKQQIPGLLPPHVITGAEKAQILGELTSIADQPRHPHGPRALRDLAELADHVGLSRLAGAWRALADEPAQPPPDR